MVLGRQQRGDVSVQHEVGANGSLDRLGHLRVDAMDQVAQLLTELALPGTERVEVRIDARVALVTGRAAHRRPRSACSARRTAINFSTSCFGRGRSTGKCSELLVIV